MSTELEDKSIKGAVISQLEKSNFRNYANLYWSNNIWKINYQL